MSDKMNNKIENKIIKYIKKMYMEQEKLEIEITIIDFKNTKFNKYTIDFDYIYTDKNIEWLAGEILYLDLEKISYFDNVID